MLDTDHAVAAEPADLGKRLGSALFVSARLGDAVVACADLLARNPGSDIVTVFGGAPEQIRTNPDRDRSHGYDSTAGMDSMREEEDLLASFLLDANPIRLAFVASQRGAQPQVARIAEALQAQVGCLASDTVVFPLGIGHADRRLASEACLRLCAQAPDRRWIVYAHALPGLAADSVAARTGELERRGWSLQALRSPPMTAAKRHAVDCYGNPSRRHAAPSYLCVEQAFGAERYWQIAHCE